MDRDALANMLKGRTLLAIFVVIIIVVAAAAAYVVLNDDGGDGGEPMNGLAVDGEMTISEDRVIEGDLTVGGNGKLTITDGAEVLIVGTDSKLDVKGTLDASDGYIAFATQDEDGNYSKVYENDDGETRSITSTGTLILSGSNFESEDHFGNFTGLMDLINGAVYDKEPNIVVTSVSAAVGASDVVSLYGSFQETGTVALGAKDVVTAMSGSDVGLGTVTLVNGSKLDATAGRISSSVSDAGNTASVSGSGVTFTVIASGSDSLLVLDGDLSGTMSITAGTVYVDELTVDRAGSSFNVALGATMVLQEVGNDVAGVVETVSNDSAGNAVVVIDGTVVVGTRPTSIPATGSMDSAIDGKITLNGTIKVYPNADKFTLVGGNIGSTGFYIDGSEYMTVYGDDTIADVLSKETVGISTVNLTEFRDVKNWNVAENMSGNAVGSDTKVGATGFTQIHFATVKVTLSVTVPDGVKLSIDGTEVTGDTITLAKGDHTYLISNQDNTKVYVLVLDGKSYTGSFAIDVGCEKIDVVDQSSLDSQTSEGASGDVSEESS